MIGRLRFTPVLGSLALCACDPVHSLHLQARVTAAGHPVAGAWVISLAKAQLRGPRAVRSGADGTARAVFSAFLGSPMGDPIAVHHPAHRPVVALPVRDFVPRPRGWVYVREWDANLEVDLARPPPGTSAPLACGEGKGCEMVFRGSVQDSCIAHLLETSPERADASVIREPRYASAGNGSVKLSFDLPAPLQPASQLFLALVCYSTPAPGGPQALRSPYVVVSDAAQARP